VGGNCSLTTGAEQGYSGQLQSYQSLAASVGKIRTITGAGACEVCSHHARALVEGVESLFIYSITEEGEIDIQGRVCGDSPKNNVSRYRRQTDSKTEGDS